jgi:hypothetical protein
MRNSLRKCIRKTKEFANLLHVYSRAGKQWLDCKGLDAAGMVHGGEDGMDEYIERLQATGKDDVELMPTNACYGCRLMRSASTFL